MSSIPCICCGGCGDCYASDQGPTDLSATLSACINIPATSQFHGSTFVFDSPYLCAQNRLLTIGLGTVNCPTYSGVIPCDTSNVQPALYVYCIDGRWKCELWMMPRIGGYGQILVSAYDLTGGAPTNTGEAGPPAEAAPGVGTYYLFTQRVDLDLASVTTDQADAIVYVTLPGAYTPCGQACGSGGSSGGSGGGGGGSSGGSGSSSGLPPGYTYAEQYNSCTGGGSGPIYIDVNAPGRSAVVMYGGICYQDMNLALAVLTTSLATGWTAVGSCDDPACTCAGLNTNDAIQISGTYSIDTCFADAGVVACSGSFGGVMNWAGGGTYTASISSVSQTCDDSINPPIPTASIACTGSGWQLSLGVSCEGRDVNGGSAAQNVNVVMVDNLPTGTFTLTGPTAQGGGTWSMTVTLSAG